MSDSKTPGKNPIRKRIDVHSRRWYEDHSVHFTEWARHLSLDQSRWGGWLRRLDELPYFRPSLVLITLGLGLSALLFTEFRLGQNLREGQRVTSDIRAPMSFDFVDERATERKRLLAENAVLPVFSFDMAANEGVFDRVNRAFRGMRDVIRQRKLSDSPFDSHADQRVVVLEEQRRRFESDLGSAIPDRHFTWLAERGFSKKIENSVIDALAHWHDERLVATLEGLPIPSGITQFSLMAVGRWRREVDVPASVLRELHRRDDFPVDGIFGLASLSPVERAMVNSLAVSLLVPNVTFNHQETQARRDAARAAVLPVNLSIKKNQLILSAGSVVQADHLAVLNEIANLRSKEQMGIKLLAGTFLFLVVGLVLLSYLRRFSFQKARFRPRDVGAMAFVLLLVVGITKVFVFMAESALVLQFGEMVPQMVPYYLAPIVAGPLIVGLLIPVGEIVWLFTMVQSLTLFFLSGSSATVLIVSFVGGLAAARGVHKCQKRNDIYWAGLRAGVVVAATVLLLSLASEISMADGVLINLVWYVVAGFVGGVFSSLLAMMLVPFLESLFNYTTDVKLLELASLNHPLLQDLVMKAPGTYHHCMTVSNMVEAAASEIGANALLAKVMALYHDIGKMEHAQYFVENQKVGVNPHDHISPFMSKTILIAHVKDGAEMGMRYKLGKPIIDGILQHHGTTLISYFYNRALEEESVDLSQIQESDFRYPGPKPQFKEAALVMLADSIEATARSLDDPTTARLQNVVKNIIQSKFIDGQLDECNLTLRDLSIIEKAFKRTLLALYHQRMDYPHLKDGKSLPVVKMTQRNKGATNKGHHSA